MFVDAINKVGDYTRAIHIITREYGNNVVTPNAATLFFVNDHGQAITCKHVAIVLMQAQEVEKNFQAFKIERGSLTGSSSKYNKKLKDLRKKYGYQDGVTIQIKSSFINCVEGFKELVIDLHPTDDIAIITFKDFKKISYKGHATFLKDISAIKQGKFLCRLGFPFSEFSNFKYNEKTDSIEWVNDGKIDSPRFPIEGMVTRKMANVNGIINGIEMSTPGLIGQSGGPLFDQNGIVYGIQSGTHHLHLGFDLKEVEIKDGGKIRKISDHPFLHLGHCVSVDIIKSFLKEKGVEYDES